MSFELAKEKAIRYIAVAKKTEHEVNLKLKRSDFDDEIISNVIEYLKKIDYINDSEYVDAYIRQCMRLLNYSIYEIKNKLLQKGIKKYIIEEKLDLIYETDYEEKLKEKLLKSKLKNMEDIKKKNYLYKRGFKNISLSDY